MFRRLALENTAALFTIAAFITAFSIYVSIAWRALRMKRSLVEQFENLPFSTPTPASVVGVALRVSAGTASDSSEGSSRCPFDGLRAPSRSRGSRSGLQ